MKKNIGTSDRVARLAFGLLTFAGVFFVTGPDLRLVLGLLAFFSIYEALIGWCALYVLIGKNTCPIE